MELHCGNTFGESVISNVPRRATIITKENCQLLRVEQDDFRQIWERNQELMETLVGHPKKQEIESDNQEPCTNTIDNSVCEADLLPKMIPAIANSSGEETEDNERCHVQIKTTNNSNWSPRAALRQIGSIKRKGSRKSLVESSISSPIKDLFSHMSQSPSSRNVGSPNRHVESPNRHVESPNRHVESPNRHVESPNRHVESPNRHIGSSNRHVESPNRHVGSPYQHDGSPTRHDEAANCGDGSPNWLAKSSNRSNGSPIRHDNSPNRHESPNGQNVSPTIKEILPLKVTDCTLEEESPTTSPPPRNRTSASDSPDDSRIENGSPVPMSPKQRPLSTTTGERRSTLPDTFQSMNHKEQDKVKNQSKEAINTTMECTKINRENRKQSIKLPISSKRFSENPRKSLTRSGLSPSALKKAFQFTRSSSWTQRKLATASPTGGQKTKPECSNSTPKRRPSLLRASSFDTSPEAIQKKIPVIKASNPEFAYNNPGEDDEDSLLGVTNEKKTMTIRESLQINRTQEITSPSNAALPILETPSVRVCEAAWVLRTVILHKSPNMLQDRRVGNTTISKCAIGVELTEWLVGLSSSIHSRAQAASMWQVLLEEGALQHVSCAQPFRDKHLFYRFLEDNAAQVGDTLASPGSQERRDAEERLPSIIAFLTQKAPDATIRLILRKPSHERTLEDQELIYEELLHLKALTHLTNSVKRELAAVIKFESHMREGAVLFEQGKEGKSWFIIIRGSVDVVIRGKGVVTTLQEGDDFGELALVNEAPRAATIVLKEDNCQFLRVDKCDFNRILRDVEANTVRLKEHGKDVLVLEKVSSQNAHSQFKYTVMSGNPQKMLEHLLETRLDGRKIAGTNTLSMGVGVAVGMGMAMGASMGVPTEDSHLQLRRCDLSSSDFFLDDFLLTHVIFMPYSQLTENLFHHYRLSGNSVNQDEAFIISCKKRVVHFTYRWVMTISDPIFANKDASKFLQDLRNEVEEDNKLYGSALREESSLMMSAYESLERYDQEVAAAGVSKWKLPTSGKPISLFASSSLEDTEELHIKIHAHDDIIFRVYCADHTYCTLRFPLSANAETVKRSAADKLGINLDNLVLVELKSNGETSVINDREVCIPTGITINGRLFVAHKDHLDALTPLPDQEGPKEGTLTQLEMYSTKELAYHITSYDWDLFITIHEYEFIYQVYGRGHFGEVMCNLDVFKRRFNEIQFWVATEVCYANTLSKRTQLLRKFIKLADYCKEMQNLNAFFAIVMGLGNVAVSRLTQTWERLSSRSRKMFIEFEMLIDPTRNHRSYRLYVAKLHPPIIPFTPLLMKDMTFTHEGNRSHINDLINFEKMHMLAQTLRTIRHCRSKNMNLEPPSMPKNENDIRVYVRNLHIIDNPRRLQMLSQRHEPKRPN